MGKLRIKGREKVKKIKRKGESIKIENDKGRSLMKNKQMKTARE